MDILPILSTLKRHKTAAGLIVLQIALTCAIVCNALFLISERIATINAPTGMPDKELLFIRVGNVVRVENPEAQTRADLAALKALDGVKAVTLVNQMPFGNSSNASGMRKSLDDTTRGVNTGMYASREGWLETLGLRLVEGRDFAPEEYVDGSVTETVNPKIPAVIINRRLAQRLFPGESALGKPVYVFGTEPQRVVGVLETLPSSDPKRHEENDLHTMMQPIRPSYRGGIFVLRVDEGRRDAVLKAAVNLLGQSSLGAKRIVGDQNTFEAMRNVYYRQDRAMVWLLGGVCAGLLIVTAFGIVGLASFWVQQRTRMIGTRRALGATQGQILRYFQTENFILSTGGIALGMAGAYGISLLLMREYELPRLPLSYLPVGALILWALGQIAVWGPARRAAALAPLAALRA